mmetsp:Transcript_5835/g.18073  ORF Transcript_5835/g.18073 Transcript_5835/m.18073 type:complete len:413 (+) Transcript_5835:91-1329(+)
MITYTSAGCVSFRTFAALVACIKQSTFRFAVKAAIPSTLLAACLKLLDEYLQYDFLGDIMPDVGLFTGLNFSTSFFIIFRTSQAYARFDRGAELACLVVSDFSDSAALLLALSRAASCSENDARAFRHTLVRLVSLLSLLCLSELAFHESVDLDRVYTGKLIDVQGLDPRIMWSLRRARCKPEVAFSHVQNLVADNLDRALKIPPPLLSCALSELGRGMLSFHRALDLLHVPFPFPYLVITEVLVLIYSCAMPFVICTWARGLFGAASWTFMMTFIMWCMLDMASELDMPFGESVNDLDLGSMQDRLNERLLNLLEASEMPPASLTPSAVLDVERLRGAPQQHLAEPGSQEVRLSTKQLGRFRQQGSSCDLLGDTSHLSQIRRDCFKSSGSKSKRIASQGSAEERWAEVMEA